MIAVRGSGRLCKCDHYQSSHHRREDWCSGYVRAGDPWASDRYVGFEVVDDARIELHECKCERFTRRHR